MKMAFPAKEKKMREIGWDEKARIRPNKRM